MSEHDQRPGGPGAPRDDVAADLAALRRAAGETDAIARESAGLLSELAPRVFDLDDQLTALRDVLDKRGLTDDTPAEDPAVTAAKAARGMRPVPPGPWCWPLLAEAEAAAAWDALARWVEHVLVPGYELTRGQLVDCWARHPRLVAELSGLRHAYLEATARRAPARLAADWHARQLPATLTAVRETGCGPDRHLTGPDSADHYLEATLAAEPATRKQWETAWHEAMTADLTARRPGPSRGDQWGRASS